MFSAALRHRLCGLIVVGLPALALVFLWQEDRSPAKERTVQPPGRVEGLVRDSAGKPEASVVVLRQLTLGHHIETVTADDAGRFTADGLPLGRYVVTIRGDLVGDVEITPNRPAARVTLEAPPWNILRGVVRDQETGHPIPGAIVIANMPSRNPSMRRYVEMGHRFEWSQFTAGQLAEIAKSHKTPFAFTDSEGRYELLLGDEVGLFFAAGPNFDLLPQGFELTERVRGSKDVDFALAKRALYRIHGRVVYEDGKPFAAGTVHVFMRRHPDRFTEVVTDHQGRYSFDPVHELSGELQMAVAGFSIMRQHVPLDKEPPFPAIDWVLKRSHSGTLKATITRGDGKPIPDDAELVGWLVDEHAAAPKPGTSGAVIYYGEDARHRSLHLKLTDGKGERALGPGSYAFWLRSVPLTDAPKSQRCDIKRLEQKTS